MGITVNAVEITDADVEAELPYHQDAANPVQAATQELILRQLLREEIARKGIDGDDIHQQIATLLAQEVRSPQAGTEEISNFYRNHPEYFRVGDLAEADHILFQVTPEVPLERLRAKAESILAEVRAAPEQFAEFARSYSNCPSGEVGGNLGQLQRGETVPEFEAALWRLQDGEIADYLIETRFGLHVIRLQRKVEGQQLPLEQVADKIAEYLAQQSQRRAMHQYLQILVGQAKIEGFELSGIDSPLVQ